MPVGRYITWVGASLLTLLFVLDWYLPKPNAEATSDQSNRPVIRIASVQQPPERIVIDTNQPTIVPPIPLVADEDVPGDPSQLQSYASAASITAVLNPPRKKNKAAKRQEAAKPVPVKRAPAVTIAREPATPPTRMSFLDFVSKQFGSRLFGLN
jgi:hypothetical protein